MAQLAESAGILWFTPQEVDEYRLQRDSDAIARGEVICTGGCALGDVEDYASYGASMTPWRTSTH